MIYTCTLKDHPREQSSSIYIHDLPTPSNAILLTNIPIYAKSIDRTTITEKSLLPFLIKYTDNRKLKISEQISI